MGTNEAPVPPEQRDFEREARELIEETAESMPEESYVFRLQKAAYLYCSKWLEAEALLERFVLHEAGFPLDVEVVYEAAQFLARRANR